MKSRWMRSKFEEIFKRADGEFFFAPGRVNLIGEHTDYNGGHVLPCALEMGTWALAAPRSDGRLALYSLNFPEKEGRAGELWPAAGLRPDPAYGWRAYPLGVAAALEKRGRPCPGADILYYGDLPSGAGLSSSASIEVLTALIFNHFHQLGLSGTDLALLGQEAENNFVGVHSGIMDQFAAANCRRGHALLLNCESLAARQVPLELGQAALLVADSGKRRGLAESKYNQRRAECEAALARLNELSGLRFKTFGEMELEEFADLSSLLDDPVLLKRAAHAVSENIRTLKAAEALEAGDLDEFGRLMNASHISLRDDYEVSGPELDALAEAAWRQPRTIGARMTGAGFGGCAVILCRSEGLEEYRKLLAADYKAATGLEAVFYQVRPADGAGPAREIL